MNSFSLKYIEIWPKLGFFSTFCHFLDKIAKTSFCTSKLKFGYIWLYKPVWRFLCSGMVLISCPTHLTTSFTKFGDFLRKNKTFCRFFNIFCDFSYWKSIYCVDLCEYTLKLCWWIVKMEELANNHKIFHQIDQFQQYFSSEYGRGWYRKKKFFEKITRYHTIIFFKLLANMLGYQEHIVALVQDGAGKRSRDFYALFWKCSS